MAAAEDAVVQPGSFMSIGHKTTQPIGHFRFCKNYPDECRPLGQDGTAAPPVRLDAATMRQVAEINRRVNAAISPKTDRDQFGVEELWTYPDTGIGDCEDFALEKRKLLHQAGIALSDLLMTVVRKPDGEGHAVLTLRTTQGDFVLDNLNWRVKPWRETNYRFLKRQSDSDPGQWNSIEDGSEVLVSAVKN